MTVRVRKELLLLQLDYVEFSCPQGFAFEDSRNLTHRAFCHDWNYRYMYDFQSKCKRE